MGRSQGYIQRVPQTLEHQPALRAVPISRSQAPASRRATKSPLPRPDVFLCHSSWRAGDAATSGVWSCSRAPAQEPSPRATGVLAGVSRLGADMLEAGSRAILQQAAAARMERHFSPPCRDKTASCDSRSLLPSPRSVCHTAAIDKTLKEQEVSLAEAPGRASCGCTANEPKWSTLPKAFTSFQALTVAPTAACLAATMLRMQRDTATSTTAVPALLRQRRQGAADEKIEGRVGVQPVHIQQRGPCSLR